MVNKSIVIYTSRHGSTHKIASYIGDKLQCDTVNLLEDDKVQLSDYDLVIIGGSIYYGSIDTRLSELIESNLDLLLSKKLALFLVCMMCEDSAADQFNNNYPQQILAHSCADGFFGGLLSKENLGPIEKMVTSVTFHNIDTHDNIYFDEVDKFIEALSDTI